MLLFTNSAAFIQYRSFIYLRSISVYAACRSRVFRLSSKNGEITIAGDVYPKNLVKSKFLKLNYSHVEYVINCLGKNTTKVRNIKSYLLASLFNAGSTISSYYRAEVNHDMPQYAG